MHTGTVQPHVGLLMQLITLHSPPHLGLEITGLGNLVII